MSVTLHDMVGHAVRLMDVEQRQYIWLGLVVTRGVATYVKGKVFVSSLSYIYAHPHGGIAQALQTHISSYILSNADQHNEVEPKQIRNVKVPEYFAEYREKGDGLAAFLGSSIVVQVHPIDFCLSLAVLAYLRRSPSTMEKTLTLPSGIHLVWWHT